MALRCKCQSRILLETSDIAMSLFDCDRQDLGTGGAEASVSVGCASTPFMRHLLPLRRKQTSIDQQAECLAKLLPLKQRQPLPKLIQANRLRGSRRCRRGGTRLLPRTDMGHLLVQGNVAPGTTVPVVIKPKC